MKNSNVRRRAHWMVVSLLLPIAACGGDPTGSGGGGGGGGSGGGGGGGGDDPSIADSVMVWDFAFDPASIVVTFGATVTWTWFGTFGHNVTFADTAISAPSATQIAGTFRAAMPTVAGVYAYQCTNHPTQMNGTVTVQ